MAIAYVGTYIIVCVYIYVSVEYDTNHVLLCAMRPTLFAK